MKNRMFIALSYLRYYKRQTAVLFLGVILSSALLAGMGGLLGSGKTAALENARSEYGDWHYSVRGEGAETESIGKNIRGEGYSLEKIGVETVRKRIEEPFSLEFVYGDQGYLDMMGRKIIEGHYPVGEKEIALDRQTINNLGIGGGIGSRVTLDGEEFTLGGILSDMPKKLPEQLGDCRQVFVNSTLDYGENGTFLYLKFDEGSNVYYQIRAFCDKLGLDMEGITRNNGIGEYIAAEPPVNMMEIIREGISHGEAGIPYIWGQLNEGEQLTTGVILCSLLLFGAFIIYSIFQFSIIRRMSQYSMMRTVGMTDGCIFALLMLELGCICLAGYPIGCILGNFIAWIIYQKAGQIFIVQKQIYHMGVGEEMQEYAVAHLPAAGGYQINWQVVFWGAVFLIIVIAAISLLLIRQMNRLTIRQMMARDVRKHVSRRIYSIKHSSMTGILTRKFMYDRKGTFVGIILSLSLCSVFFLGAYYVMENTRINNELVYKADDGLGSDIQVYGQSEQLTDVIPEKTVKQMEKISGIESLHPVRYLMGEITLRNGKLRWPEFFAELAKDESNPPDPVLQEKYHGVAVQDGERDYRLKVNIYGYDDEMLEDLEEYLLEGEINPDQMRQENSVILKTLMDGQGNYDGIDIQPGEGIQLKTPNIGEILQEALRFEGKSEWYQRQELRVAALASRPLAKVDTFIGDNGTDAIDIIMTNEQMEKNFGVSGYRTLSITTREETEAGKVSATLAEYTSGLNKFVVKDYSRQIAEQNQYLDQKMFFYYGIAAVLLGISLLHIMNSMQYLVFARKQEFGILRAMGITDEGFQRMLAKEGLRYGLISGLAILFSYFVLQKILYYFMVHVYLFLHPQSFISMEVLFGMIVLNIALCIGVILLSGRSVLKLQVIEEIKTTG